MNTSRPSIERALKNLGGNIRKARLRRRWTRQDFAEQTGVSLSTARRLESGKPGVALNALLSSLQVLGLLDEFSRLLAPEKDAIGLVVHEAHLPKRGRRSTLE